LIVLYPVNLIIDLTITLQPGEFNFERPSYDVDILIKELNLNIDPKQFSDLLDFIKFQNYSKLYGMRININYSILIIYLKDRCREYRELQLKQALNDIVLTSEQEERIQVIIFLIIISFIYLL
jgi:hypothetical protein